MPWTWLWGWKLCTGNLCSLGIRGGCLIRDRGYFSCRAVVGGIEESITKVKGFWIYILGSWRTRIRKEHEELVKNKRGYLIFPFIHMKSICFEKLHFQRHMCKIRVPKMCDRIRLSELKSSWIASGIVYASLWAVINGGWSKLFISELPLSSPQWESQLPGVTRRSFLMELGTGLFLRARSKAIQ